VSTDALEALRAVLSEGGEPDDVLRAAVAVLAEEPRIVWTGIAFSEEGELVLGPQAGEPDGSRRVRVPVHYEDAVVGELWVDGDVEPALLERVAAIVAPYVLIGWDTGGERWEP
jgi:hypothetical protein